MTTPERYKGHNSLAEMISNHLRNYRVGLLTLEAAATAQGDTDNASYWQHEIKALGEIEHAVSIDLVNEVSI